MRFATWEPVYRRILHDFDYSRAADERARDVLASIARPSGARPRKRAARPFDQSALAPLDRATVAVCGAAPSLEADLDVVREASVVVAASTAADVCLDAGVAVDLVVTDLDGNPATARRLTGEGVPVAVHAHGDNVPAIREHVPTFDLAWTLPTTQAAPVGPVENFGGFTDGDRGAFLADHFGAAALRFPGWDFDDPSADPAKRRKLAWAERLLHWLERRRGEQFAVLDGRRDALDVDGFPT